EAVGPDCLVLERERRVHQADVVDLVLVGAGQRDERPAGRGEPERQPRARGGAKQVASLHEDLRAENRNRIPKDGKPALSFAATMNPAESDAVLMARIEARDARALGELYDRHAPRLLGLARRILGGGGEAEEVVQEVFLYAWRAAASYDPGRGAVLTWL